MLQFYFSELFGFKKIDDFIDEPVNEKCCLMRWGEGEQSNSSFIYFNNSIKNELIENYDYPSPDEMIEYLEKRNIGYVFEKNKAYDWKKKRNSKDLKKYYLACVLSKNMGDITNNIAANLPAPPI